MQKIAQRSNNELNRKSELGAIDQSDSFRRKVEKMQSGVKRRKRETERIVLVQVGKVRLRKLTIGASTTTETTTTQTTSMTTTTMTTTATTTTTTETTTMATTATTTTMTTTATTTTTTTATATEEATAQGQENILFNVNRSCDRK